MLKEQQSQVDAHALRTHLPIGCLSKLFTATLVAKAMRAGRLSHDTPIAQLLDLECASATRCLDDITVTHLLEHTHGLDDSTLAAAPKMP